VAGRQRSRSGRTRPLLGWSPPDSIRNPPAFPCRSRESKWMSGRRLQRHRQLLSDFHQSERTSARRLRMLSQSLANPPRTMAGRRRSGRMASLSGLTFPRSERTKSRSGGGPSRSGRGPFRSSPPRLGGDGQCPGWDESRPSRVNHRDCWESIRLGRDEHRPRVVEGDPAPNHPIRPGTDPVPDGGAPVSVGTDVVPVGEISVPVTHSLETIPSLSES